MAEKITYETLMADLGQRKFKPVYFLMGEEPYFIDKVTQFLENNVLAPEERDFNQTVVYGIDTNAAQIADMARRFPMMAQYQVVIVKEAQNMKGWEKLKNYFEKPSPTTILVISYKGKLSARLTFMKEAAVNGVVFNSVKIKDWTIPAFIENYLKEKNATIEPKAKQMVADAVGNDLARLASELDKTLIGINDARKVTPEIVESKIGISKDYNFFELRDAIVRKDVLKANRIVKYIDSNPKTASLYAFLPGLFSFFQNLMIVHYTADKSERGVAAALNFKSTYPTKDYLVAKDKYGGLKTMQIIHQIRVTDAKSKGIDNPNTTPGDLLKELVFFILH
ncbi:MAG: DNA polymerase III subunit delta [Prevotella sp.]|nr:DNA polymerase III subunit delta [Prevotella sp.]MBO4658623.1 DNA polymerase III subunit delta [Prevotella sp.]